MNMIQPMIYHTEFSEKYNKDIELVYTYRISVEYMYVNIHKLFKPNINLNNSELSNLYIKYANILIKYIGEAILLVGIDKSSLYGIATTAIDLFVSFEEHNEYINYDTINDIEFTELVLEVVQDMFYDISGDLNKDVSIEDMLSMLDVDYSSGKYISTKVINNNILVIVKLKEK